jgi:hypothetical protein
VLIEIVYGRSCHVRIVRVQAIRAHRGTSCKGKSQSKPAWKQESPQSKKQKRKQTADRKAQSLVARRQANEGKQLDIAAADLFAGLRTVHVAAKGTRANLVLAHATEKCPFAKRLQSKTTLQKRCIIDVRLLDSKWADAFVAEALRLKARVILVMEVFHVKVSPMQEEHQERT